MGKTDIKTKRVPFVIPPTLPSTLHLTFHPPTSPFIHPPPLPSPPDATHPQPSFHPPGGTVAPHGPLGDPVLILMGGWQGSMDGVPALAAKAQEHLMGEQALTLEEGWPGELSCLSLSCPLHTQEGTAPPRGPAGRGGRMAMGEMSVRAPAPPSEHS